MFCVSVTVLSFLFLFLFLSFSACLCPSLLVSACLALYFLFWLERNRDNGVGRRLAAAAKDGNNPHFFSPFVSLSLFFLCLSRFLARAHIRLPISLHSSLSLFSHCGLCLSFYSTSQLYQPKQRKGRPQKRLSSLCFSRALFSPPTRSLVGFLSPSAPPLIQWTILSRNRGRGESRKLTSRPVSVSLALSWCPAPPHVQGK